ncbi:MAG TPA: TonB family protein [Candidatus Acidoferrum sp.]|nr:TonB family protein [Candidatus Acidoferrum sp.]
MNMREVKRKVAVCLLASGALVSAGAVRTRAQSDSSEVKRKVKTLGKPVYPELARRLSLSGVVRVELTIGADGRVKRTRVLGGHPVLAAEAEKAAQQSEFEPGPRETTEVIEFKFNP